MEKTIQNLAKAFIGESQARNRYSYYAKIAQSEGYEQIGAIFLETSDQEKQHAKKWLETIQLLKKKSDQDLSAITVEAEAPTTFGTTIENLKAAIAGETYEHVTMYPGFADDADTEGLKDIADRMRAVGLAEAHHHERYQKLLDQLEAGTVFKKDEEVSWVCRECGYVHTGKEAPKVCPSCDHAQAFYQVKCEQY